MKIGYACINTSLDCTTNSGFILKNYSEDNLKEKVKENLNCLQKILEYNVSKNIYFFRIGSGLIPFASHPVNKFNWQNYFKKDFERIGKFIKENNIRVSMHPGQYTILNSPDPEIVSKSVKDILYHTEVLDLMKLDKSAKVQIHVGGVYGDKEKAKERFVKNYKKLPQKIKNRLAVENDDSLYSTKDCLDISNQIKIPVIFDVLHHRLNNNGEKIEDLIFEIIKSWKKEDGIPMVDYSSHKRGGRSGSHSQTINLIAFKNFLKEIKGNKIDVMFEVKDKNISAEKAVKLLSKLNSGFKQKSHLI